MSSIQIFKSKITEMKFNVDCIVNSTNSNLMNIGKVCQSIFSAAGEEKLHDECMSIGYCEVGDSVITSGYNLSKYIIHTVGPKFYAADAYPEKNRTQEKLLYSCYNSALKLAKKHNIHKIVFPLISSGELSCETNTAWNIALKACYDFIFKFKEFDISIFFAVTNDEIFAAGHRCLKAAKKESGITILENIDTDVLKYNINYFCRHTEAANIVNSDKKTGQMTNTQYIYPVGMKLGDLISELGGIDPDYNENIKAIHGKLQPSELDVFQIRTYLTHILRGEKFIPGHIAVFMSDRTILKLCLRLDDLVKINHR